MGRLHKRDDKAKVTNKLSLINWNNIKERDLNVIAEMISESYYHDAEKLENLGLKVLHFASNPNTGFEAIAVKFGKDVVILFPGTKNWKDLINDAFLGISSWLPQCKYDVEIFFDDVIKASNFNGYERIICLGHSLGAILSDFAVATQHAKHFQFCKDIRSITIENPGSKGLLRAAGLDVKANKEQFQIFNSHISNGINSMLEQFANPKIVQVDLINPNSSFSSIDVLKNMLASHAVGSFNAANIKMLPEDLTKPSPVFLSAITKDLSYIFTELAHSAQPYWDILLGCLDEMMYDIYLN